MESRPAASSGPLETPVFKHQVVRDLHWVLASPHLLQPGAGLPLWEDQSCVDIVTGSMAWLEALDACPEPLRAFLKASPQHHRLGHYFAALVEFWLRHCPCLASSQVLTRQEFSSGLGKLKFLAKTEAMGPLHLEAAIHWSLARGTREVDVVAARFAGAFLHESLCWRVLEARNRIRLAEEPGVVEKVQEALGGRPRSLVVFRGYVFYKLSWLRGQGAVAKERLTMEGWQFLSKEHAVGWWTHDAEELLASCREDSKWALLENKRYWLSPVVGDEDAAGRVSLLGDAAVKIKPLEVLDAADFRERVKSCRHLQGGHPVLASELRRTHDNRWLEASRGFLLPANWSMEAPQAGEEEEVSIEESSITQLQLSLERLLYAGTGLERWWQEADRLAEVAGRTERRSVAAQEARLSELWQPSPAVQPLEISSARELAEALEARWPEASSDEEKMVDLKCAVLAYLAVAQSPSEVVVFGLAGLCGSLQQRVLGHMLLDGFLRLGQRRGCVIKDQPLTAEVQSTWDWVLRQALAANGSCCRKLAAKAARSASLPVPPAAREEVLRDLHEHLSAFGYPGEPVASTQREAQLTGAVQLCNLRLREPLSYEEAQPMRAWLLAAGEGTADAAFAAAAPADGSGRPKKRRCASGKQASVPESPLPPLSIHQEVRSVWVDSGLATAEQEIFAMAGAEGGVIALDAEWRPYSQGEAAVPVELLQLAVPSCCWLLDVRRLAEAEAEMLAGLLRRLCGGECVLLGYGLDGDLRRLFSSCGLPLMNVERAVDLRGDGGGSLRTMVRASLACELDKAQQCSDWALRPLSPAQLSYAALDAHVLLLLLAGCSADASPAVVKEAIRPCSRARPLLFPKTRKDVDEALNHLQVPFTAIEDIRASADTAAKCKTLALTWSGQQGPEKAVAVLGLQAQLSLPLAAAALGVAPCDLRLAPRAELTALFGFEAGSLGPFGLRQPCRVLLDAALQQEAELSVSGGQTHRAVRVPRAALLAALEATVAPLQKAQQEAQPQR